MTQSLQFLSYQILEIILIKISSSYSFISPSQALAKEADQEKMEQHGAAGNNLKVVLREKGNLKGADTPVKLPIFTKHINMSMRDKPCKLKVKYVKRSCCTDWSRLVLPVSHTLVTYNLDPFDLLGSFHN